MAIASRSTPVLAEVKLASVGAMQALQPESERSVDALGEGLGEALLLTPVDHVSGDHDARHLVFRGRKVQIENGGHSMILS